MFDIIYLWSHLLLLLFGRSLTIVSIFILLIGLFRFFSSSWFSLGRLYISKYWSISSRLLNLVLYTFSLCSCVILSISTVSVIISGLGDGGCSSASVLQPWLVKFNCYFSANPASLLSPFLCFLPWCLSTVTSCRELTALLGRAIQGTRHSFSPLLLL